MSVKPSRLTQDQDAALELEALLDDIHGPDRPTQGNGTYREKPTEGCACAAGYVALECPAHGVGTSPLVSQYLKDKPVWAFMADGGHADLYPELGQHYSLHVTTDGEVWLNPRRTHFTGLCIGEGAHHVEDAIETLERALSRLKAYKMGGR